MVKKNALIWIVPVLLLSSCGDSGPDYTPFGDGMKAIGICLVVCAVVRALAELVQSGNKPSEGDGSPRKRHRPDHKEGGKS
jgi:hypothetical protein